MKTRFFCLLFFCVVSVFAGWRVENPGAETAILANDSSQAVPAEAIKLVPMVFDKRWVKKSFDLEALPADWRSGVGEVCLQMYCLVADLSASLRKLPLNGLTEHLAIVANGQETLLHLGDFRLPRRTARWVEIPLPLSCLAGRTLDVTLHKVNADTQDDFFYLGVDTAIAPNGCLYSEDGGQSFLPASADLPECQGEFMMRLVLRRQAQTLEVDFAKPEATGAVELSGGATVKEGLLCLDGKTAMATLRGSEDFNVTENGFTMTAVLRQHANVQGSGRADDNMLVAFKPGSWFAGRTGDIVNLSFCTNGRPWNNASMGGNYPEHDTWMHLAIVFERVNESAQGNVGYNCVTYINGEAVNSKFFLFQEPDQTKDCVLLGNGITDYGLNGEIRSLGLYARSLTAGDIEAMVATCPLLSQQKPGFVEISSELASLLENCRQSVRQPELGWLLGGLRRAAMTGYDQQAILAVLSATRELLGTTGEASQLAESWNARETGFRWLWSEQASLLLATGRGQGNYPVLGLYSPSIQDEVLDGRGGGWVLKLGGVKISDFTPGVEYEVANVQHGEKGWEFDVAWERTGEFVCRSHFIFAGGRLEQTFAVENRQPAKILKEVAFPLFFLKKLPGQHDHLVFPLFSGVVRDNPTANSCISGLYPSARASMQFLGYFDEGYHGVYYAFEAVDGGVRTFAATGLNGILELRCTNAVGRAIGTDGGNGFQAAGPGVLQLYQGDWFEAGQIYKQFVEARAPWRVTELPRQDTPRWYRDNLLWMVMMAGVPSSESARYLRGYFEVPFAVWLGWWEDIPTEGWPLYIPNEKALGDFRKSPPLDIYLHPYLNAKMWGFGEGSVKQYVSRENTEEARRGGVIQENGKLQLDHYGFQHCAVLCHETDIFQELFARQTALLHEHGIRGTYYDQLPCTAPVLCFNPDHGHPLGDPTSWVRGYWQMLKRQRERFPEQARDGEDNCEVYVKALDGFMTWRFTEPGHVPLFQSLYGGGRCQFTSRAFEAFGPGNGTYDSDFAKLAEQLCYSEQIGWLHIDDIRLATPIRLQAKKFAHVRKALLDYFLASDMLRPLNFRHPVPTVTQKWGGNGLDGKTSREVTTAQILHCPWRRLKDGRILIIFTNTMQVPLGVEPILDYPGLTKLAVCAEGQLVRYVDLTREEVPIVILPPHATEIWLLGADDNREEAESVGETMRRIATFDSGELLHLYTPRLHTKRQRKAVPGAEFVAAERGWQVFGYREDVTTLGFDKNSPEEKKNWVLLRDGAAVSFGGADFGAGEVRSLVFRVACSAENSGGRLSLWALSGQGQPDRCLAELEVPDTGGWFSFQDFAVPLASVQGQQTLMLRYFGEGRECAFRSFLLQGENYPGEATAKQSLGSWTDFALVKELSAQVGSTLTADSASWMLSAAKTEQGLQLNEQSLVYFNHVEFTAELPREVVLQVEQGATGVLELWDVTASEEPYYLLVSADLSQVAGGALTVPLANCHVGKRHLAVRLRHGQALLQTMKWK